jgi:Rad3-related DNA helicase
MHKKLKQCTKYGKRKNQKGTLLQIPECRFEVEFPFEPYESQRQIIETTVRAITQKQNAMMESPTGTGKTLALLCGPLSWQKYVKAKDKQRESEMAKVANERKTTESDAAVATSSVQASEQPKELKVKNRKIYYCTRTHSQMKQIVHQLSITTYKPSSICIASRKKYCLNPEVQPLSNRDLIW